MTESTPPALAPKARTPWRKIPWIGMLCFAEGTPFGVVNDLVPLRLDSFGPRRKWICAALLVEAALLALAAWLGALLLAYTAAAATVDIAIDAHTIELTSTGEEGPVNDTRAVAYRAAWFVAGGAGVGLAGEKPLGPNARSTKRQSPGGPRDAT